MQRKARIITNWNFKGFPADSFPAERRIPNKVRDTSHDSGEVPHEWNEGQDKDTAEQEKRGGIANEVSKEGWIFLRSRSLIFRAGS